eukprot:CAMPEP_0194052746 /NCGR_PEP_ID=MMETSP0009_2-20130614/46800_1 /TAXON_ID=210454 /ORGANISM="Grammatophora oceanica, Strain CCMP 410" /LENGTH=50 /DNA_ID=CAMNT_0038700489 /DNA_START=78 /DNA_END=230 /DNA_ORIENTATION=+
MTVILNKIGATAYCHPMIRAIPSFDPEPLNSTMTMTLLAVGVMVTIMRTR